MPREGTLRCPNLLKTQNISRLIKDSIYFGISFQSLRKVENFGKPFSEFETRQERKFLRYDVSWEFLASSGKYPKYMQASSKGWRDILGWHLSFNMEIEHFALILPTTEVRELSCETNIYREGFVNVLWSNKSCQ